MIPVVRTKPGVKFAVITPAGFRILAAIDRLCQVLGHDVTISCGTEGHGPTDPHTEGAAYDLSVLGWTGDEIELSLHTLRGLLIPAQFYIQYEVVNAASDLTPSRLAVVNPAATASHVHIQRKKNTVFPPQLNQVNA